jgi:pimeloyl-ACP methyl ester carboxylesterase
VKTESRIKNGEVALAVTRAGSGRKIIFFNGACSTQVIWKRVVARLKGQYEIITFDFRNHGKASPSPDHSYEAFLTDAERIMAAVGSEKPIVVGWSLGADLAVSYAASHPGAVGGLVIIDGAVPVADKLVEDEPGMRRLLNSFPMKLSMFILGLTSWRYRLSGDDIADIVVDVDTHRQHLPNLYAKVDCPVVMVLATKSAGENTTEHARRNNKLWREGGERFLAMHPSTSVKWLDAGHRLPLTKPSELAETIDDFAKFLARH